MRRSGAALLCCLGLLFVPPSTSGQEPGDTVLDSGLVETTRVRVMLLDVEAVDKSGRPVRGLSIEDIVVRLNGRIWPVVSVDDLCACGADEDTFVATAALEPSATDSSANDPAAAGADPPPPPREEQPRFVLFFDFGQLQTDGRARASEAARNWIAGMSSGDEAMIAAYSADAGLRILSDFTTDRCQLREALAEADATPELSDPFPSARWMRIDQCKKCCSDPQFCNCDSCALRASREEYTHSRNSLEALEYLLEQLGEQPGRKALLLFHQNGTLFPSRVYGHDELRVGTNLDMVDRVGAEATLSRTAIYVAHSGVASQPGAVNLGANLADVTGGGYNRGVSSLTEFTEEAGRSCACIYRIGLEAPQDDRARIYRVVVEAGGRTLSHRHRIRYLGAGERWVRQARTALRNAENVRDVPIVSAVTPVALHAGTWDVSVQIAVDTEGLTLIPSPGSDRLRASWEVGALLTDEPQRRRWELLGQSKLTLGGEGHGGAAILHERILEGLKPGTYELRAFVRDRLADVYGGSTANVTLPSPDRDAIVGPVILRSALPHVRSPLPLLAAGATAKPETHRRIEHGRLPLGNRPIVPGMGLEFATWICLAATEGEPSIPVRYVSLEGQPLFRFDRPGSRSEAGRCLVIRDALDTTNMTWGRYTYHLRWDPGVDLEPLRAQGTFRIGGAAQGDEAEPWP